MDFEDAYRKYHPEILVLARRHYLPGMDADDIASEMTLALWKAFQTYNVDTGTPFGAYWWSVWQNRRSDLVQSSRALKHPSVVSMAAPPDWGAWQKVDPEPPATSPVGRMVWRLLAAGEQRKDVLTFTELSKRGYYALIQTWRNDVVRDSLRD